MILDECIAIRVCVKLDGILVDECLILDRDTLPCEIVDYLAEAYDLSDLARNRLFELINPQLASQKRVEQLVRVLNIDISIKGLRLKHQVLFDLGKASPYELADQLIVDFGLARTMEEYWMWNKMIVFSILWNYQQQVSNVENVGLELVVR